MAEQFINSYYVNGIRQFPPNSVRKKPEKNSNFSIIPCKWDEVEDAGEARTASYGDTGLLRSFEKTDESNIIKKGVSTSLSLSLYVVFVTGIYPSIALFNDVRPVNWIPPLLNRKVHRWAAIATALPVIIVSGIILQVKKEFDWIQPPTQRGESTKLVLSFEQILNIVTPSCFQRYWT